MINKERLERFRAAYITGLTKAVTRKPDDYFYKADSVPMVVNRMLRSVEEKGSFSGVNHDSPGIRNACKELGIKHTRTALDAFVQGKE